MITLAVLLSAWMAHADSYSFFDGGCYEPNHNIFVTQRLSDGLYVIVLDGVVDGTLKGVTSHAILGTKTKIGDRGYISGFKVRRKTDSNITLKSDDGFEHSVNVWAECLKEK